jgi:hypothetical protein
MNGRIMEGLTAERKFVSVRAAASKVGEANSAGRRAMGLQQSRLRPRQGCFFAPPATELKAKLV